MQVFLHGGKCCGIKQIYNLRASPGALHSLKRKTEGPPPEQHGYISSAVDFFTDAAPCETADDRLTRVVAFIQRKRPAGVIEIVLSGWQAAWRQDLIDRGFELVTKAFNSNSEAVIEIYHLVYDVRQKKAEPEPPLWAAVAPADVATPDETPANII